MPEISYEEERERLIRENAEFLLSLGIEKPAPKKTVKRRVKSKDEDDYAPKRDLSTRKRSKPVSYRDDAYNAEYSRKKPKTKKGGSAARRENPGRRIVSGRVYDSALGRTCHQCRQKTMDKQIACSNDHCTQSMDYRCLLNRYDEDANTLDHSTWTCPKCREICNCSFCMKKRGRAPTGQLSTFIKINGIDAAKRAISAEKISDNVLYPPKPVRHGRTFEGIDMASDYDSDDDVVESGRKPTRASQRLSNKDVRQKISESVRGSQDDLEWTGWSDCPRNINCIVLIE
ncbi:hypothetical protein LPJ77_001256 [Coemansia sp. RSA 2523]|nr:hypothetical protein LPJ58_002433 [Coemansia sp. RSA 1591]KAJ1779584.1 hypothetical protein LPJ54_000814 [Coemansia sp. RSA 1824]KAJ1809977.1 hypothetical protein LPJ77_001256 [Coemansia sp. RSA 2523]KAJ2138794.1 hypothetical protein GGH17_000924 [Coemansia sp. RSA 788]KAJ2149347.1 hypothetical protein IW142_000175 [Coemansia sp. RSA 564]KAJ2167186.1 hypothetical protein GGH15_002284 [Coemansia sp. RSA 562]KAJ2175471.1 hypothetical protein GGH16_000745 [Coemansia sp. RSA 560]KAJ2189227.1 